MSENVKRITAGVAPCRVLLTLFLLASSTWPSVTVTEKSLESRSSLLSSQAPESNFWPTLTSMQKSSSSASYGPTRFHLFSTEQSYSPQDATGSDANHLPASEYDAPEVVGQNKSERTISSLVATALNTDISSREEKEERPLETLPSKNIGGQNARESPLLWHRTEMVSAPSNIGTKESMSWNTAEQGAVILTSANQEPYHPDSLSTTFSHVRKSFAQVENANGSHTALPISYGSSNKPDSADLPSLPILAVDRSPNKTKLQTELPADSFQLVTSLLSSTHQVLVPVTPASEVNAVTKGVKNSPHPIATASKDGRIQTSSPLVQELHQNVSPQFSPLEPGSPFFPTDSPVSEYPVIRGTDDRVGYDQDRNLTANHRTIMGVGMKATVSVSVNVSQNAGTEKKLEFESKTEKNDDDLKANASRTVTGDLTLKEGTNISSMILSEPGQDLGITHLTPIDLTQPTVGTGNDLKVTLRNFSLLPETTTRTTLSSMMTGRSRKPFLRSTTTRKPFTVTILIGSRRSTTTKPPWRTSTTVKPPEPVTFLLRPRLKGAKRPNFTGWGGQGHGNDDFHTTTTSTEAPPRRIVVIDKSVTWGPNAVTLPTHGMVRIAGTLKITNLYWSPKLADRNTQEYKFLSSTTERLLEALFMETPIGFILKSIEIDGFSKGSVLVDYFLLLKETDLPVSEDYLVQLFVTHLRENNTLGNYTIDPNYTEFDVVELIRVKSATKANVEPAIPQWAIAVVVIAVASVIFIILFGAVTVYGRHHSHHKYGSRLQDDDIDKSPCANSKDLETKLATTYENIAADSTYGMDDVTRDKKLEGRSSISNGKPCRSSAYFDSWRTDWTALPLKRVRRSLDTTF